MPIPMIYQHTGDDFERFLADAKERADLVTRNQTFTMVEAVFHVFRRRLTLEQGLRFALLLPPVLRALFIDGWTAEDAPRPFGDRETLTREVQAFRGNHNFAPDTAITVVAAAVRAVVDGDDLDAVLAGLPPAARDFWATAPLG